MADVAHEERPLDSEPAGKKVLDTASKSAPRCPNFEDKDQQQQQDNQSDPESPQNYYTLDGERNGEDVDNATSKLKEVDPKPLNGKFDTVDGVEDNLPEGSEVPDGDEVKDVQDKAKVADGEVPEGSVTSKLSMAQRAKQAFSAISGSKPASVVPEDDVAKDVEVPDTETGVEEDDIPKDAEVPSTDVGVTGDDLPKDAEVPETTDAPIELKNDEEAIPTGEEKDAKDEEAKPEEAAEEEEEEGEKIDYSILKNAKVNKGGNLVDSDNKIVGRVREGILVHLVGKRADENGDIWNDGGKVIGKAEPIPDNEREALLKEPAPFESFPDAVVDGDGKVTSGGQIIGTVIEGDVKVLQGKSVDPDGDILDRGGNVIGKAKRLEAEPEPEPEPEVDRSVLGGKRVNKAGNVVDKSGAIFGRVVEGDPKSMVGRMCDKKGNILNEMGDVIGRAEVVLEAERDGLKEGPFAELIGCTVTKEGKVVTPGGDVVGRLVSGDPKVLYGRSVDEDGDVCDKNGNVLGKAERWEEPVVEKKKSPLSGRRVNREGNVVDEDGNLIAKLTTGTLNICSGMEIDDDGDVVNSKGVTIGHVSLLEDIPEPEPEPEVGESPEEKEKREQVEKDRKLAQQMSVCIEQCLDKVKPICTMITDVCQGPFTLNMPLPIPMAQS